MNLSDKDTYCVVTFSESIITNSTVRKIIDVLNTNKKTLVIDLTGVRNCVNNFFKLFRTYSDIVLINTDSLILSTLYVTGFDKYVKIYGDRVSFEEKKNELINRRFELV